MRGRFFIHRLPITPDPMKKNFLYIGLLLFVLGLVTAFATSQTFPHLNPIQKQLVLNSGSIGYVALPLSENGLLEVFFNSSSPVDFYFANATAFGAIDGHGNISAREKAVSLEGNGVYSVYEGADSGSFPVALASSTPVYLKNITSLLSRGTYYALFDDVNASSANINLVYASWNETTAESIVGTVGLYGTVSLVLLLAGLAICVAALLMKDKKKEPPPEQVMDEQAKKEYERIDKAGKRKGKHSAA